MIFRSHFQAQPFCDSLSFREFQHSTLVLALGITVGFLFIKANTVATLKTVLIFF